jgi:hypothetical protein
MPTRSPAWSARTCAARWNGCRKAALVTVKTDCDLSAHMASILESLTMQPKTRKRSGSLHPLQLPHLLPR